MRAWLLLPLFLLAACAAPPNLSAIHQECGYDSRPFDETWPCVKVGFAGADVYPDIKAYYVAAGDVAYERVRSGKMTDAEAKMVMAQVRQNGMGATLQRNAISAASGGAISTSPATPDANTFTYSSGSVVSQWSDKSGNTRHATQGTVSQQPTRTGLRGNNTRGAKNAQRK